MGALPRISFTNCSFNKIHLSDLVFGSCNFQNCTFNEFHVVKSTFLSCHFENCKITNCDIRRAKFHKTIFINCNFLNVDLGASDFDTCNFKKTTVFESQLDLMMCENVKIWKFDESVEIKDL